MGKRTSTVRAGTRAVTVIKRRFPYQPDTLVLRQPRFIMDWLHRFISYVIVHIQRGMTPAPPGCVSCFPGRAFPGPCARRRLGRRRSAERRGGHRCLSEWSERVSMGGRSRPRAFSRSADRPGDFLAFPFLVGQKRGPPGPVRARYVGRPHTDRLIDAFQRSTPRSERASLAMERDPSLSGIADMRSDSHVIWGTTSETLDSTLDAALGGSRRAVLRATPVYPDAAIRHLLRSLLGGRCCSDRRGDGL